MGSGGDRRPDIRVIGVERQVNCSAIEIYDDLPAAMSAVTWTTLANAEHSVYLPLSNLITDVAEAFDHTPEGFTSDSYGYDLSYAHTHFKRLCALSEQDREHYGTACAPTGSLSRTRWSRSIRPCWPKRRSSMRRIPRRPPNT